MDRGEYGQGLIERYRLGEWHSKHWFGDVGVREGEPLIGSREEAIEALKSVGGAVELLNEV